ncbi:MAG: hypothetical protein J6L69_07315 [Lachnospiraceae bacterium]|nr:hypothetical protein [Lachnospiraceae bacterium]
MGLFSNTKGAIKKRRAAICKECEIFIQVHYVRESGYVQNKLNSLSLKSDEVRDARDEWYEKHGNPDTYAKIVLEYLKDDKGEALTFFEKANLSAKYEDVLKKNLNYVPSKSEAIIVCMGLKLNIEETRKLIYTASYTLANSRKEDLIIRYFIENKIYNVDDLSYIIETLCEKKFKDIQ